MEIGQVSSIHSHIEILPLFFFLLFLWELESELESVESDESSVWEEESCVSEELSESVESSDESELGEGDFFLKHNVSEIYSLLPLNLFP